MAVSAISHVVSLRSPSSVVGWLSGCMSSQMPPNLLRKDGGCKLDATCFQSVVLLDGQRFALSVLFVAIVVAVFVLAVLHLL